METSRRKFLRGAASAATLVAGSAVAGSAMADGIDPALADLIVKFEETRAAALATFPPLTEAEERFFAFRPDERREYLDIREACGLRHAEEISEAAQERMSDAEQAIRDHAPLSLTDLVAKARCINSFEVELFADDAEALIRDILALAEG